MPVSKSRKKGKKKTSGGRSSTHRPTAAESKKKVKGPSPLWYVITMFGLMGLGILVVLARYIFGLDNMLLIVGLGGIAAGFLMTTAYR